MLSGDNEVITKVVSEEIGIKEFHYKLTPEDKYNYLEELTQNSNVGAVAYVGDGINDAPSLALADIGISMGINGSASSIDASDVVIADDKPKQIVNLVKISKNTTKIVKENIIFAMTIKLLFLVLSALGITNMVFAVFADVGVTLIAIINSMRALFYKPNKKKKK
jgi:Cd2+/Zn2+-exporting ATPase